MTLPDRIPKRLRERAIVLPQLAEGEGAWSREDALAVLASLEGSLVSVSEVVVFDRAPWGFEPTGEGLSIDRRPNEGDADYASRSRDAAAEFVRGRESGSEALFALTFPWWKEAA